MTERLLVQSLEKALAVLEAFGGHTGQLSFTELVERSGLDKSTVQRMAYTLTRFGYLERGRNGRGYRLGKKILDRAFDFLRNDPLIERAAPVLMELRKTAHERVDLSLFDDLWIVYAMRLQSKRVTFFATLIGRRMPTFSSSGGRAILSHLPDDRVQDIIARSRLVPTTPKTKTDPAEILGAVHEARANGFAVSIEESLIGEVVCAAAILEGGDPVAAVHIAGSLSEWSAHQFVDKFAPLAVEAARALSR